MNKEEKCGDYLREIIDISKGAEELAMMDEGAKCLIEFRAIQAKAEMGLGQIQQAGTCDTCKWWATPERALSYGPENPIINLFGLCENPKVTWDAEGFLKTPNGRFRAFGTNVACSDCSPEFIRANHIETEDNHAIPLDYARPDASDSHLLCFSTGPKFGCVQWASKY